MQQLALNQPPEMGRYAGGQRVVPNQEAQLDTPVEGRLGQVRGAYKERLVIDHEGLGMQDALRPVDLERAWIVEHA